MNNISTLWKCSVCKREKTAESFYVRKDRIRPVASRCKECTKIHLKDPEISSRIRKQMKKYRESPEVIQAAHEYYLSRIKDPKIKAQRKATSKAWRERNLSRYTSTKSKWRSENANSVFEVHKQWVLKNEDLRFNSRLLNNHGISIEQFFATLEHQDFRCAGCDFVFSGDANVDHCHSTGQVRGLLCANCNKALGLLKDNPYTLQRLSSYLVIPPFVSLFPNVSE